MKQFTKHVWVYCLALAGAAAWGGQSSAKKAVGDFTISGVVVNEKTGQPLPRVTMTLSDTVARGNPADTTTDEEGNFRFDHLPAGRYMLGAMRHGYIPQAFQEHSGGVNTAIVTGDGKPSTGLRFTLKQQASVFGNLAEDSGDPVPRARVLLFRKEQVSGAEKIVRVGQTMASEAGDFEMARLRPGRYYVCATGTPWYARRMAMGQSGGAPRSPLDVAYGLTCYPGVTDPAEAELVELNAGDRLELPIKFHAEPAIHVVLPFRAGPRNRSFRMPVFNTQLFGTAEFAQPNGISIQQGPDAQHSERMLTVSVAPGQYQVTFPGEDGHGELVMTMDASADTVTLDPAAATKESGVSGKVTMANVGALPQPASVWLIPGIGEGHAAGVLQAGDFRIDSVPPGDYRVRVGFGAGWLGVTQITAKGATVHAGVLRVGTDPVTLNLSVAAGNETVAGVVQRGNAPASGVFVLLVPEDRHVPAIANQSDSDGTFEYRRVLPGTYTVVAIEDGWTLNWGSREVLERYLPGGERITVPNAARVLNLSEPLQAQSK